jgi:Protein of unknown function (DUF1698)
MNLLVNIKQKIKTSLLKRLKINVLDNYVEELPTSQVALDIFKNEWVSKMPDEFINLQAGDTLLFEDKRITWLIEKMGGIKELNILELGPLEAGHTFMLERAGAKNITAIEANKRAFLKCLVIKEILRIKNAEFRCGDFNLYLQENSENFDLCVASGVLYHQNNPIEFLYQISNISNNLFIWTHYFDEEVNHKRSEIAQKFTESAEMTVRDFKHKIYQYNYGSVALGSQSFCGGGAEFSRWLTRSDILGYLKKCGFSDLQIAFEDKEHPNGASFAILARK